jgi:serine/threonine protein kinase
MYHPKVDLEARMQWIRMKGVEVAAGEEGWTRAPLLEHSQSLEDRMASLGLEPPSHGESGKMSKSKKKRLKKKVKKLEEEITIDESAGNSEQKEDEMKTKRAAKREEKDRACRAELDRLVNWGFPTGMNVGIIDFGSSCFAAKPFSDVIQTRQYRAPEVILGCGYDASADIWGLACVVFELITGCYLFDPRKEGDITRSQDHLSLMVETLGPIPKDVALSGKFSDSFFTKSGKLRHLHDASLFPIRDILIEEHGFSAIDASEITSFLEPMLHFRKSERATSAICLDHPWMREDDIGFDMERLSVDYESSRDGNEEENLVRSAPIRRSCSEGNQKTFPLSASSSSSLRGSPREADTEMLDLTSDEETTEESDLHGHDDGIGGE